MPARSNAKRNAIHDGGACTFWNMQKRQDITAAGPGGSRSGGLLLVDGCFG
jgi:hypothetical protein